MVRPPRVSVFDEPPPEEVTEAPPEYEKPEKPERVSVFVEPPPETVTVAPPGYVKPEKPDRVSVFDPSTEPSQVRVDPFFGLLEGVFGEPTVVTEVTTTDVDPPIEPEPEVTTADIDPPIEPEPEVITTDVEVGPEVEPEVTTSDIIAPGEEVIVTEEKYIPVKPGQFKMSDLTNTNVWVGLMLAGVLAVPVFSSILSKKK